MVLGDVRKNTCVDFTRIRRELRRSRFTANEFVDERRTIGPTKLQRVVRLDAITLGAALHWPVIVNGKWLLVKENPKVTSYS